MKDAGATPTYSHLHDNSSRILLGRAYWQGRKAAWAGHKHFTLNIRSGGTEQPVCWLCVNPPARLCMRVHVRATARESLCERRRVCGTCVGVCVFVGEQHSYPSKSPVGRPLPREKNEPCPTHSARCRCSSATISSWFTPEWLWVGQTHLASHRHATFTTLPQGADTYIKDAGVACMLIQLVWKQWSSKECLSLTRDFMLKNLSASCEQ